MNCWGIGKWCVGRGEPEVTMEINLISGGSKAFAEALSACKLIPPARQRPLATLERLPVQVMRALYF
jgi:hypothetical protein